MSHNARIGLATGLSVLVLTIWAGGAWAVPSFARQTGMPCSACHVAFPQLTPFGRVFKLTGYSLSNIKQIQIPASVTSSPLKINEVLPLSLMFQTSLTHTASRQPDTQNDNVEFPQQLSLFLAGEVAGNLGSFLQATYSGQDDHFTMDNADFRYSGRGSVGGRDLVYGLTVNNSPGVADPWHATPVWGFPWASADSAPTPAAAPLLEGALAQQVAGLGVFALWDEHLYVHAAVYRSAQVGQAQPPTGTEEDTIKGVAPYWRIAWQQTFGESYLEVGTYGLYARQYRGGVSGPTDKFTDIAFDAQYERHLGDNLLTLVATYIHEMQDLDASHEAGNAANTSNELWKARLSGTYTWATWAALSLGYFRTSGDKDSGLYAPAALTGSANGRPASDGWIAEMAAYPSQNLRLSLQYTLYRKFNGSGRDYDGAGRDASDNNTLYALAWFAF